MTKGEAQLRLLVSETASKLYGISQRLEEALKTDDFSAVCEAVDDIPNACGALALYIMVVQEAITQEAGEYRQ